MIFQWHITNRCNLRCLHCYQQTYEDTSEFSLTDIEQVLEQIDQFSTKHPERGRIHLTLTGGEPLLFPHLEALIKKVHERKTIRTYSLLTNGHYVDAARVQFLKKYPPAYVQISLDGTQEKHEIIRGKGSFVKAVQGVRQLVAARIRTTVSFTATKKNYKDILRLSFFCNRLNINHLWTDRVIPSPGDAEGLSLGPDEVRKYIWLLRLAVFINLHHPFTHNRISFARGLQFLSFPLQKPYRCAAGRTLLALMPNGDLYPCRRMEHLVGNFFERSISKIYETNELLNRLQDNALPVWGCEKCRHAWSCHGGLKCLARAKNGDPFTRDPGCYVRSEKVKGAVDAVVEKV
ncbi:MAG: radical SAM protein [Candidatus Electrothrix sp. GW3-4]|uniref:radical SAM/SPASM domain-containing protein n=1 Tax=Candidatus Electrothrix sp. GW3-4 TaxID=3126740 RepID=UPI0030D140B5